MRSRFIALLLVATSLLSGCGYNRLQELDEGVKASWSEVVNQYQRRSDLIPNLVNVVKGGKLFLNDTAMTSRDLATKLAAIAGSRPDRQVYVRADQSVPYGEVMAVIGSIREAGLAKVGLVTEPPAERSR